MPSGFQQLLDHSARIVDVDAGRAEPDRSEGIRGGSHCQPQVVLGLAQLDVIDHRGTGQGVHRPRQRGRFGYHEFVVRLVVFELGHQPDRLTGILWMGDDHRLARGYRVPPELGARGQAPDIAGNRQHHRNRRPAR